MDGDERDRGTQRQSRDFGYGLVCDLAGAPIEGLAFTSANQEHGLIDCSGLPEAEVDRFPIGTRLRILPNHACATGAQFPCYQAIDAKGTYDHGAASMGGDMAMIDPQAMAKPGGRTRNLKRYIRAKAGIQYSTAPTG